MTDSGHGGAFMECGRGDDINQQQALLDESNSQDNVANSAICPLHKCITLVLICRYCLEFDS